MLEKTTAWTSELALLKRLVFKNKNQHRNTIYYRKLCKVCRCASKFDVDKFRTTALEIEEIKKTASQKSIEPIVVRNLLGAVVKLANCLHSVSLSCKENARPFHALIAQTYFMPFALVILSVFGRIFAVSNELLKSLVIEHALITASCFESAVQFDNSNIKALVDALGSVEVQLPKNVLKFVGFGESSTKSQLSASSHSASKQILNRKDNDCGEVVASHTKDSEKMGDYDLLLPNFSGVTGFTVAAEQSESEEEESVKKKKDIELGRKRKSADISTNLDDIFSGLEKAKKKKKKRKKPKPKKGIEKKNDIDTIFSGLFQ
eukprot:g2667.t1